MKKLGDVAASASEVSRPTVGRQLKVRTKVTSDSAPPNFEPFTDRQIPDRVWQAWVDDGSPRLLTRQMTQDERIMVERRAVSLEAALSPQDGDHERMMIALAELYDSYRSMRPPVDDEAMRRVQSAARLLAEFPGWAVEVVCVKIRKAGYIINGRLEQTYAPSDAQIHSAVAEYLEPRRKHMIAAQTLLQAAVAPKIEESMTPLETSMDDFRVRMAGGRLRADALELIETERREKILAEKRQRDIQDRRNDYIANGLPAPTGDNFTTLPMMLKLGWRIEEFPDGTKQLVGGPGKRMMTKQQQEEQHADD